MAKLYFYFSAMNAGKSTTLLQSAHNYEERDMRTLLFTPKLDDRFGEGRITSRIGLDRDCEIFTLKPCVLFLDSNEYVLFINEKTNLPFTKPSSSH